jgi:hypothetical protein
MSNEVQAIDMAAATECRTAGLQEIEPYITLIQDGSIRSWVRAALAKAPVYFWLIPASSSGKYHPTWAQDDCGLFRHTVFGMYMAHELSRTWGLSDVEHDIALAASSIHDTLKYGIDYDLRYFDLHPYLPRSYYVGKHGCMTKEEKDLITPQIENAIFNAVERHMGSLAKGEWHSVGRVKPENIVEQVVHVADYVASRQKVHFTDFLE